MAENLTESVKLYNKTGRGLESIRQQILLRAYDFPRHKPYCSEEDCGDFLLSFYPRIKKIISNYASQGASFEAYLQSCFVWHMKTFIAQKFLNKQKEKLIYEDSCESLCRQEKTEWEVHEEHPLFAPPPRPRRPLPLRKSLRIMLLALKCADEVNDPFINRIAEGLGTHNAIIFHLVEILRTTMRGRTERMRRLTEKRRQSYASLYCLMDLREDCKDAFHLAELDRKISRTRQHIESMCRVLATTPRGAVNSHIARILGMSKGAIDSRLFHLLRNKKQQETVF